MTALAPAKLVATLGIGIPVRSMPRTPSMGNDAYVT